MSKIKVFVSNTGAKRTQYHYKSSQGALSPGQSKEISIDEGDTLYFENDGGVKHSISASDSGKTFTFNK